MPNPQAGGPPLVGRPRLAYSIYSQLPSIPGGLPSIRNLRTRHAVVTRDPPNMDIYIYHIIKSHPPPVHILGVHLTHRAQSFKS
jgi:hypothetical protein